MKTGRIVVAIALSTVLVTPVTHGQQQMKIPLPAVVSGELPGAFGSGYKTEASSTKRRAVAAPVVERVLFPVLGEDSDDPDIYWATELWLRNDSDVSIPMFFPTPCQIGEGCPPLQLGQFPPHSLMRNPTYAGRHGTFMTLGAGSLPLLTYTYRIENVAGLHDLISMRSLRGTELPIVSEHRFRHVVNLLNVPASGGSLLRKVLRIYALGTDPIDVKVTINAVEFDTETPVYTDIVALGTGARVSGYDAVPAFAKRDLTDIIASAERLAPQGRVSISVTASNSDTPLWAFVALIPQETRQMTTITPGQ